MQVTAREILFGQRNFTMAAITCWDMLPREVVESFFLEILKIQLDKPQIVQVSSEHLQPPV